MRERSALENQLQAITQALKFTKNWRQMVTILNTSILTSDGVYRMKTISLESAKVIIADGFQSAVGHQATAEILTELLGVPVPVNRIMFEQADNSSALVFKLKARAPEGTILSREEIEKLGYEFKLLERFDQEYLAEKQMIQDYEITGDDYQQTFVEFEGCTYEEYS